MIKKLLFICVFLTSLSAYSQINEFWLYGKVRDSAGVVKNVNILNLKTDLGTFSNDFGDYKIKVSIGDTLKFTSVQHKTSIRVVNKFIYTSEILNVFMVSANYVLDEIVVKQHDLDGFLALDLKKTPNDRRADALRNTLDFSNVDFDKEYEEDFIDLNVRPPVVRTDPTLGFVGAGAVAVIPFKHSERLWALRKKIAFQQSFPNKLLSEFGEKFFVDDLKIPKIRYYHFLEYCNPLGIEKLYQQNRKIEMINILKEQSKSYLKLIEQETKE